MAAFPRCPLSPQKALFNSCFKPGPLPSPSLQRVLPPSPVPPPPGARILPVSLGAGNRGYTLGPPHPASLHTCLQRVSSNSPSIALPLYRSPPLRPLIPHLRHTSGHLSRGPSSPPLVLALWSILCFLWDKSCKCPFLRGEPPSVVSYCTFPKSGFCVMSQHPDSTVFPAQVCFLHQKTSPQGRCLSNPHPPRENPASPSASSADGPSVALSLPPVPLQPRWRTQPLVVLCLFGGHCGSFLPYWTVCS